MGFWAGSCSLKKIAVFNKHIQFNTSGLPIGIGQPTE